MVAAWLCLSYALSEDAPTCIERVSFTTFAPSTTYAKCSCPWCLVSAVRVADIYCEFVSIITFSYISGLGASGRLSTHICTYPCILCPISPFCRFLSSCRDTPLLFWLTFGEVHFKNKWKLPSSTERQSQHPAAATCSRQGKFLQVDRKMKLCWHLPFMLRVCDGDQAPLGPSHREGRHGSGGWQGLSTGQGRG